MPQPRAKAEGKINRLDPVWTQIRDEAEEAVRREPELSTFFYATVLNHDTLEAAVVHRIAERLAHADVGDELIRQAFAEALSADPSIGVAFRADIIAVHDRDPATHRYIEPLLYYKGFHALQT
ncbi:MAG: serine O-acetyltransferase, partial [Pseudolabrys sp.]|nr:serine O-acetyltransferase [Pseudolabrys sp.]